MISHTKKKKKKEILNLIKNKENFMDNIIHDLRTPLSSICHCITSLEKTKANKDKAEIEYISIIKASSEFLNSIVNNFLDLSKLDSRKMQLEKIPFELLVSVKNIKKILKKKATEKGLKFEIFKDSKIPSFLIGDKLRLEQILINLIGNAIKFTYKGFIKLSIEVIKENEKEISIKFSLKDSGIGIKEDKINKIFERFEQAGNDINRKYGGSGLGLNITKDILELFNSELNIKSTFGKGTEFFFTINFPKLSEKEINKLQKNKNNNNNSYLVAKYEELKGINFLICEDNLINLKLIKSMFYEKNLKIKIAQNAKIAIEILNKPNDINMILMDLYMPEMDGIELTKYIRNSLKLNIPIICFSANINENQKAICIESGMNEFIKKSFNFNDIIEKITDVIQANNIFYNSFVPFCENEIKYIYCEKINRKNENKKSLYSKIKETKFDTNQENEIEEDFVSIIDAIEGDNDSSNNINYINDQISFKLDSQRFSSSQENSFSLSKDFFSKSSDLFSEEKLNESFEEEYSYLEENSDINSEIMDVFLIEVPKLMRILRNNIKDENLDEIKFNAHTIKSSMLMFGHKKVFNILEEIEKNCTSISISKIKLMYISIFKILRNFFKNN